MQLSYNWVELSKRAHENALNVYHRLQCVPFNPQAFIIYAYRMLLFLFQRCKCVQRACVVAGGKGHSDGLEQFYYMGYE